MPSSGLLCHVALVGTDISEELSTSITVTRISELGTTLAVMANVVPSSRILVTLMMEALSSSKTSVLTRVTRHNIPEHGTLHSNIQFTGFKSHADHNHEVKLQN
jgi:hypothetical protein